MNEQKRREELAQFLRTRRERLSPEAVGLPGSSRRRTPGLRREELAQLAGMGVTWYTRLEQGQDITVSPQVLESLVRVFDLNTAERNHLFILAREQVPVAPSPLTNTISPHLQAILDSINNPAYVLNPRWDMVGWNRAMSRVFPNADVFASHERNVLRAMFTHPSYRTMFSDWEEEIRKTLAIFRASSERYVEEIWFKTLVAELEQTSLAFREWWPRHDIQTRCMGRKELYHPQVGLLVFQASTFQVVEAFDLQMVIFTAAEAETSRKLFQLEDLSEVQITDASKYHSLRTAG